MNESDARHTLLVRAYEDPPIDPWTPADTRWANETGARAAGESASAPVYIVQRARVAHHRLAEREPSVRTLPALLAWPRGLGPGMVAAAFVLGIASDALGPVQRVNILAPPLLALLAWNLAVYLFIALGALWPSGREAAPVRGPVRGLLARAVQGLREKALRQVRVQGAPALMRFTADWARATRGLTLARLTAVLHAAAAAFAVGALASLYLRGLAFEYRAGWDSTFLTAEAVHRLLGMVLGPASALSGLALPDVPALDALRFSAGPGENAARWIHLYAITIGLVVVLPRLLLAAAAALRAGQAARDIPIDFDEPYFQRLLRGRSGRPVVVHVLPYSYRVPRSLLPGIGAALRQDLGAKLDLQMAGSIPMGGEESLDEQLAAAGAVVVLFPLTATPEREHHGAFVDALTARRPGQVSVLIDESGFRQRFPGADGATRLAQRRDAWQRLLQEHGQQPRFADLSGDLIGHLPESRSA